MARRLSTGNMGYRNRQPPEGINAVRSGWQRDFILLVTGFFLALLLLFWLVTHSIAWAARWMPFSWEESLTQSWPGPPEVSEQQVYLQRLADDLAAAGGLDPELNIVVHYHEDAQVNAFATLGGHIFILEGLVDTLESEQSLAFVVAHEIAHIQHRHPVRAVARGLSLNLLISLTLGSGDLGSLVGIGGHLTLLSYSRRQEAEADDWALQAVYRHYGHTAGATALFEKMEQEQLSMPDWLMSHPHPGKRRERLQRLSREMGFADSGPLTPLPEWTSATQARQ